MHHRRTIESIPGGTLEATKTVINRLEGSSETDWWGVKALGGLLFEHAEVEVEGSYRLQRYESRNSDGRGCR